MQVNPQQWVDDGYIILRQAPLRGLQEDMLANIPPSVQWNIPLYHDDVLRIVPGSHRRANTPDEGRQVAENRLGPYRPACK